MMSFFAQSCIARANDNFDKTKWEINLVIEIFVIISSYIVFVFSSKLKLWIILNFVWILLSFQTNATCNA